MNKYSKVWLYIAVVLTAIFALSKLIAVLGPPLVLASISYRYDPGLSLPSRIALGFDHYFTNTVKISNLTRAEVFYSLISSSLLSIGFLVAVVFLAHRRSWAKYLWLICFLLYFVNYLVMFIMRDIGLTNLHFQPEPIVFLVPSLFILTRRSIVDLLQPA